MAEVGQDPEAVPAAVLAAWRTGDRTAVRLLLHPYLRWQAADGSTVSGRTKVLAALAGRAELMPPLAFELRDGQIYRWQEAPG